MEVRVLSYTNEPEKTCAISMRSTRTKEPAHVLWKKHWTTKCLVKASRAEFDVCPKEKLPPAQKCRFHNACIVRLLRQAKKDKHWGVFEHATFTVSVSGISRACTHQLVRHRLFSYLQSSSRMIDFGNFTSDKFILPKSVEESGASKRYWEFIDRAVETYSKLLTDGIPKEDARFVLPEATPQHIVITGNARNWLHFFYLRMSEQAQWEIRELARTIHKKLAKISPEIFEGAGKLEC
jgi:thymidylate synthase (FAD)